MILLAGERAKREDLIGAIAPAARAGVPWDARAPVTICTRQPVMLHISR